MQPGVVAIVVRVYAVDVSPNRYRRSVRTFDLEGSRVGIRKPFAEGNLEPAGSGITSPRVLLVEKGCEQALLGCVVWSWGVGPGVGLPVAEPGEQLRQPPVGEQSIVVEIPPVEFVECSIEQVGVEFAPVEGPDVDSVVRAGLEACVERSRTS